MFYVNTATKFFWCFFVYVWKKKSPNAKLQPVEQENKWIETCHKQ